jgi:hypothetical protein
MVSSASSRRSTLVRACRASLASLPVAAALLACGTDAVGIDACRRVESARCRRAAACAEDAACPIALPSKTNRNDDGVDACIRHYDVACLHGLASPRVPSAGELDACVAAIEQGDCCVARRPEGTAACAWLVPPAETPKPPDAGEADAGDGGGDAGDDAAR